mgnify:FL=1|jgi:hypothetical protein
MKTSIITITYDKDLEYLKYNLKSIKKFCKGYHDNVVIIDDHENDCVETQRYLDSIEQKYFINKEAKQIKKGYVRQQYMKLLGDMYVPNDTDYICHIDSDSIFKKQHTPDRFFRNNKPILVKNNYSKLLPHLQKIGHPTEGVKRWQDTTSKILNFNVEFEFMFRMPLVYPKNLSKLVRKYIEGINESAPLVDVLKDLPIMSEYNVMGAYAHQFTHEDFFWIDRWENPELAVETNYDDIFGHYSSRAIDQPDRYVDLSVKGNELDRIITDDQ